MDVNTSFSWWQMKRLRCLNMNAKANSVDTQYEDRARLTSDAVLTAVASNESHVYTVNNHLNSGSPASQSWPVKYSAYTQSPLFK